MCADDPHFSLTRTHNGGDRQGAELLLSWMEHRTGKLVEKHWDKIHKLAFRLLDAVGSDGVGRLDGAQIQKVLSA